MHAFKEHPKTRQKLLTLFRAIPEVSVLVIYLNKSKVYTRLQDEKQVLYNYVTNILLDRVCTKKLIPADEKIHLVASRRETNKFLNENFARYLTSQVRTNHRFDITVDIQPPHAKRALQVADMLSWAMFRKYEHGDESYFNLFKEKIQEENALFR